MTSQSTRLAQRPSTFSLAASSALALATLFSGIASASPQDARPMVAGTAPQSAACDDAAIDWVLPGRFRAARERAERDHRILLVKGVSFGIDATGATCATKGTW